MKIKSAMATLLVRGGLLTEGYFGGIPLGRSTHTGTQTSSEGEFSSILASPRGYLMTLSALANTFGGIVKPICLAAFRLTTNSNFIGCSTGRSAGLAPFRILST
jgi:hypothetical protein